MQQWSLVTFQSNSKKFVRLHMITIDTVSYRYTSINFIYVWYGRCCILSFQLEYSMRWNTHTHRCVHNIGLHERYIHSLHVQYRHRLANVGQSDRMHRFILCACICALCICSFVRGSATTQRGSRFLEQKLLWYFEKYRHITVLYLRRRQEWASVSMRANMIYRSSVERKVKT